MAGSIESGTGVDQRSSQRIAIKHSTADASAHASPSAISQSLIPTPKSPQSLKMSGTKRISSASLLFGRIQSSPKRAKTSSTTLSEPHDDSYTSDGSDLTILSDTPEPPDESSLRPCASRSEAPTDPGESTNMRSGIGGMAAAGLDGLDSSANVPPGDDYTAETAEGSTTDNGEVGHPQTFNSIPLPAERVKAAKTGRASNNLSLYDGGVAISKDSDQTPIAVALQANEHDTSSGQSRSGRAIKKRKFYGDLVSTFAAVQDAERVITDALDAGTPASSTTVSKREARKSVRTGSQVRRRSQAAAKPSASDVALVSTLRSSKTERLNSLSRTLVILKVKKAVAPPKPTPDTANDNIMVSAKRIASPKEGSLEPKPHAGPISSPTDRKSEDKRKTQSKRDAPKQKAAVSEIHSPAKLPLTPPASQFSEVDEGNQPVDPQLIALSQALTARAPLGLKPEPQGQPLVWADLRQELCETLPYFKAFHGGCYANDGTVYAFLLDGVGGYREYMDQDIVIARAGGGMRLDKKTGKLLQCENHSVNGPQPRSVLNNIAQRNPLIIICGDSNSGTPSKLPHKYCVLDWFKPVLVWSEKTVGMGGKIFTTVKYKFQRLDASKPSWFAPREAMALPAVDAGQLNIQICHQCEEQYPQIYLAGWMCLNGECVSHWILSNDQSAPYGELDFNPAFLLHSSTWEDEKEPYCVRIPPPELSELVGDNLRYANTCGVICPRCGRCNSRYLFKGWKCEGQGCDWSLMPQHRPIMPKNLQHRPWDIPSRGPGLVLANRKSVVKVDVRFTHGYKVLRYTIEDIKGCVVVAKANQKINAEPMGPDDMFRAFQTEDVPLERRRFSKGSKKPSAHQEPSSAKLMDDEERDHTEEASQEKGARMNAFSMNGGFPYKFITTADSFPFEACPPAMRACRSRLNWAQRTFLNDPDSYQEFNEELVFAYMEGQKIKYHDDGEKGLGPTIASASLGAPARMNLRLKAKYFSGISKEGLLTDEHPLPLGVLLGSEGSEKERDKLRKTYQGRVTAWEELQEAKADRSSGMSLGRKSRKLASDAGLRRKEARPLLSFTLAHGDIMIMHGEQIQKLLEHEVVPEDLLRFALTCRKILPEHLGPDEAVQYEVKPDDFGYDGSNIRVPGDLDAVVW